MLIDVDQATYDRIVKYSSHLGISANLVVKEALNEYVTQWDDAVEVVQRAEQTASTTFPGDAMLSKMRAIYRANARARVAAKSQVSRRSKRKPAPSPSTKDKVQCIDSSARFAMEAAQTAPTVGLIDMLSAQ